MIKEGVVQRKLKIEEFQKQINEVGPSVLVRTGTGCPEKLWMPHHRWPSRSAWMRLWAVLSGASVALSLLRRKNTSFATSFSNLPFSLLLPNTGASGRDC